MDSVPRGATRRSRGQWLLVAHWLTPPVAAALIAVLVVAYLSSRQVAFFAGDDASNEFLPYMHEIGRMIANGELPILTTRSFSGGNLLIDFGRAPFHPITLACALLTRLVGDVAVSVFFASIVISLGLLGGYVLARQLSLPRFWAAVMGWTIGLAPMLVLVYAAAWWNGAVGTVTLVWAIAALVRATRAPSWGNLLLLALATLLLAWSGWPHSIVAFAIVAVVTAVFVVVDREFLPEPDRARSRIMRVGGALVLGVLIALPQLSEYLVSSSLLARDTAYENGGNVGVPSWAQVLGAAFPMSFDFWDIWGGSIYWQIPIGFVTVLVLVAICFIRWDTELLRYRWLRWSLVLAGIFALLTQLPGRFGPLLYPFRFLAIAAVFIAAATFIALARGRFVWTRTRSIACATLIVTGTVAYTWRLPTPTSGERGQLIANLAFCLVAVIAVFALSRPELRRWILGGLAASATVFTLVTTMPFAANYAIPTAYPVSEDVVVPVPDAQDGFILHTDPDERRDNDVWPGRFSARYLLEGAAVFNGYDPVPRKALVELGDLDGFWNQGLVSSEIITVFAAPGVTGEACRFSDYRIAWVVTSSDAEAGHHSELIDCGFTEAATRGRTSVFHQDLPARNGTLSAVSDGVAATGDLLLGERTESVEVQASAGGELYFARLWWPGYTASLDGEPLPVTATDDLLLTVELPAGASGDVVVSYTPTSWRWALPVTGAALIALAVLLAVVGITDHRRRRGFSDAG